MKRLRSAAFAALLFVLCVLCGSPCAAELLAGAAKVSITPGPQQFSYQLGGYVDPHRLGHPATDIHDTCYARALVLSNGTAKTGVVTPDPCLIPANVNEGVLSRLASHNLH